MLFSSVPFLFYFLPVVVILYFLCPQKLKNTVLLLASLFFYAWGEGKLVLLFAATILLGWALSLPMEKLRGTIWAKLLLILSVGIDLALLGYFKYMDFFLAGFNRAFGASVPLLHVALPIGISFYTFQILSYTVDVYRGQVLAQRNVIDFATYVALFPQLIAGPIVRYADVAEQLKTRRYTIQGAAEGIRRFVIGLGKKVLIANLMGELCATFRATTAPSVLYYWIYAVAYLFQIYFDFSGYSDMAIGLGRLFGFCFPENFNYPYISKSITEFWRRWHISLGTWFRDYVYIPLGGNRKGKQRQIFNILVVWILTGLWHGAAWNFVLWGLLYAVLLMVEKLFLKSWLDRHPVCGHIYTLAFVLFGFVLFNATDLAGVGADLRGMFAFGSLPLVSTESLYYLRSYAAVFVLAIFGCTPLPKRVVAEIAGRRWGERVLSVAEPLVLLAIFLIVTAFLVDGSFNPFLYFRF